MSKRNMVMAELWFNTLVGCWNYQKLPVSAAVVAKELGMSRNTAKKWMKILVEGRAVLEFQEAMPNGIIATKYQPVED